MFVILGTEAITLKLAIIYRLVIAKGTDYFNINFVQKPVFKLVF